MSIAFNNTTNKNGIIQRLEDTLGFNDGDISGNTLRLAKFTAKVNSAIDEVTSIALKAGATWQYDDSNHTDYPIITTNLVAGQRDYSFTSDEDGYLILDIYKVVITLPDGSKQEIIPVDRNTAGSNTMSFEGTTQGVPTEYDKLGNGIFLDPIPNYASTGGLEIFINRESTYFLVSDTTKKAGFVGLHQDYLILKPAYEWARDKGLNNVARLERDFMATEEKIKKYYATRERDIKRKMVAMEENNE